MNVIGSDRSFRHLPEILASTRSAPERFATLVHPAASVSTRARLGHGVVVNPGVVLGGGVVIGNHVMLCPGCIVGHESSIGDYSIMAPGAIISGLVHLGTACYVGAAAVIRQRLRIGTGAFIGMGAVVVENVSPGTPWSQPCSTAASQDLTAAILSKFLGKYSLRFAAMRNTESLMRLCLVEDIAVSGLEPLTLTRPAHSSCLAPRRWGKRSPGPSGGAGTGPPRVRDPEPPGGRVQGARPSHGRQRPRVAGPGRRGGRQQPLGSPAWV